MFHKVRMGFAFLCAFTLAHVRTDSGSMLIPPKKTDTGEQLDIDKELQREVNTLKSQVEFFSNTLQNVVKINKDLQNDFAQLHSQFVSTSSQLQKLENEIQNAQQNITHQSGKYTEFLSEKDRLLQDVDLAKVSLMNKTDELTHNISSVAVEIESLANQTSYSINKVLGENQVLKRQYGELSKSQTVIEAKMDKHQEPAAFLVRFLHDRHFFSPSIILFDKVELNLKNSYSTDTGLFTAPSGGLYTFSARFESMNKDIKAMITKNNEQVAYLYGKGDREGNVVATTSTYLNLNEGDQVWLEWIGSDTTIKGGIYSQFTGHYITSD